MGLQRPWALRGIVIAVALVAGVAAWLSTRSDEQATPEPTQAEVRVVEEAELAQLAATTPHPIYWAGPVPDAELEVTENADGSVLVRYLEEGAAASGALTVASYPLADPAAALQSFATEAGSSVRRSKDGRSVFVNADQPTSVYFASPDNRVQVEVFDPSPRRAMRLALSGRVRPVR